MRNDSVVYTAGLFDGEGSVLLERHHKNEFRSPAVAVTSTSPEITDFLKSTYGGSISKKKDLNPNHSPTFVWKLVHNKAITFMETVLPYLKITEKRNRCQHIIQNYKKTTPRNGKYDSKMLSLKKDFEHQFFLILVRHNRHKVKASISL